MLKHLLKIKYNRNIINRSLFIDSKERELERELEKLEKLEKLENIIDNNNMCKKYIKSSIETKFPL